MFLKLQASPLKFLFSSLFVYISLAKAGMTCFSQLIILVNFQSCKHESWASTAKYLVEDVPVLLGLEDVEDVNSVLSVVFKSLPSNFGEFIKWIAEVRRQEDGGQSLSQEEKGRLAVKVFLS